jgi:hypothetical protein
MANIRPTGGMYSQMVRPDRFVIATSYPACDVSVVQVIYVRLILECDTGSPNVLS